MSNESYVRELIEITKEDIDYLVDYRNRLSMYVLSLNDRYAYKRVSAEKMLSLLKEIQDITVKITNLKRSIGDFE